MGRKESINIKKGLNGMKNGRYGSFAEVAEALGYASKDLRVGTAEELKQRQEAFRAKHKCKSCGEPMVWINGTSIMVCQNPKCKGVNIKKKDGEGTIRKPSYYTLNEGNLRAARELFAED